MKIFITYSDENFIKQKKVACFMAKRFGKFDKILSFSPEDIENSFFEKNRKILEQKRGAGYWLWKSYFMSKILKEVNEGDYIFYSDAGAAFLQPVDILISELEKNNQDIMGFEINTIEKQWTKKELFRNLKLEEDKYKETNQIMGTLFLVKKTKFSIKFFEEYLEYAQNSINITDEFEEGVIQDEKFIEHRHDQSIFSLLYKKYNLTPFKDPTQWGEFPEGTFRKKREDYDEKNIYLSKYKRNNLEKMMESRINKFSNDYKNLIYLYRRPNHPIKKILKYKLNLFLRKFIYLNSKI